MIEFLLNQEKLSVSNVNPCTTVLDFIRFDHRLYGTKEGCASGDCGACSVVVAELKNGELCYRTLNACLTLLPTLQGKQLITVEHLSEGETLHPVQQSLVETHGSQCGFCTPGIVMSLFALFKHTPNPGRQEITTALAGNLCRCTGYSPIIRAAEKTANSSKPDQFDENQDKIILALQALQKTQTHEAHNDNQHFFSPTDVDELADLYSQYPHAHLFVGGTDLALEITQELKILDPIIYLGNIEALKKVDEDDRQINIGSAAPLADCMPILSKYFPDFSEVLRRFGSVQIRNAATMGGNLANASPIGDSLPGLLALDAKISLRKGEHQRTVNATEFFIDYRHTILGESEFIENISFAKLLPQQVFKMYKVSKRIEEDISAVVGAFCIGIKNSTVVHVRLAFGGMAEIPKRALLSEQALLQKPWNIETIDTACSALLNDFEPISDVRASARYRLLVAQNLLKKYFFESQSAQPIGVVDYA